MSEQDDEVDDSHPQVANTATDEFPIKRRVSFQEGGPIVRPAATELVPVAEENDSPQLVTEYNDAENNDSENNDEFIVARSRSKSEVAPSVIQRFALTRERKWSVTIASLVAAIPGFLLGLTLGYPSNAILDLTGEATELPEEFFFNDRTISLFAVSEPQPALCQELRFEKSDTVKQIAMCRGCPVTVLSNEYKQYIK